MQQTAEGVHVFIEAATGIFVFAGFVITLLIKNNQSTVKEELVKSQNEMRIDMDVKHAENKTAIAVHTAEDREKFSSMGKTLTNIEINVGKIMDSKGIR